MGNQRAVKKKAVGIDFKRAKHKVGRKLAPADNATKTTFKSKAIVMTDQNVGLEKAGVAVTQRKQTLKELLAQCGHYSAKVRKDALHGLRELLGDHPRELALHTGTILETVAPRVADPDKAPREALKLLLRTIILPGVPEAQLQPFAPILLVHICSAMTHLVPDIRTAALGFLDLLVDRCPRVMGSGFSREILGHYVDLLSRTGPGGRTVQSLLQILSSLQGFLRAVYGIQAADVASKHRPTVQEHFWGKKVQLSSGDTTKPEALHSYRWQVAPGSAVSLAGLADSPIGRRDVAALPGRNNGKSLEAKGGQRASANAPAVSLAELPLDIGPDHYEVLTAVFVPLLLQCCGECTPGITAGAAPDTTSLHCLLATLRIFRLLFQLLIKDTNEKQTGGITGQSSVWTDLSTSSKQVWGDVGETSKNNVRAAVRKKFAAPILQRLRAVFPLVTPAVKVPQKNEEDLVAVNIAICQLLGMFLGPSEGQVAVQEESEIWETSMLDFYEGALRGTVLPSAGIAERVTNSHLAEPHWKALLPDLPRLLSCTSSARQLSLLEAFTAVYEGARPTSNVKVVCLKVMESILLQSGVAAGLYSGNPTGRQVAAASNQSPALQQVALPEELVQKWLQSLPRLLWDLKKSNPATSEVVLRLLLHIGRCAPPGSPLANHFSRLQPSLVALFCVPMPSKRPGSSEKFLYGPFVSLPAPCQCLALDAISYQPTISPPLLKALALCSLHKGTSSLVSSRVAEMVYRAYGSGGLQPADLLSFLLTLLLGKSKQPGGGKRKLQVEANGEGGAGGERAAGDVEVVGGIINEVKNVPKRARSEGTGGDKGGDRAGGGKEGKDNMGSGKEGKDKEESVKDKTLDIAVQKERQEEDKRIAKVDERANLGKPLTDTEEIPIRSRGSAAEQTEAAVQAERGEAVSGAGGSGVGIREGRNGEEGKGGPAMEIDAGHGGLQKGNCDEPGVLGELEGDMEGEGVGNGCLEDGGEMGAKLEGEAGGSAEKTRMEADMVGRGQVETGARGVGEDERKDGEGTDTQTCFDAEDKTAVASPGTGGVSDEPNVLKSEADADVSALKTSLAGGVLETDKAEEGAASVGVEQPSVGAMKDEIAVGSTDQGGGREEVEGRGIEARTWREASSEVRGKREGHVGAVCSVLAHMGDGALLLALLEPAICRELETSPSPLVLEALLLAVAVCCSRQLSRRKDSRPIPAGLGAALPLALAQLCVDVCQDDGPNEASRRFPLELNLRPCVVILTSAPYLLPAVISSLSAHVAKNDASVLAAMAALRLLCSSPLLQRPLLLVEAALREAVLRFKEFSSSAKLHRHEMLELTSRYQSCYGTVALLYGWNPDGADTIPESWHAPVVEGAGKGENQQQQ